MEPRLARALERRAPLFASADTDAFRLIHRAADGFPTLAVDRFADVLVAHVYGGGAAGRAPSALLRELAEAQKARAVYVKRRPAEASRLTEQERAEFAPAAPLLGEPVDELVARENGLQYWIRPGAGLSVGLFLDMRETRRWVRAHAAGKTALNCFAYTCGFGVAAAAGGAARVINLDVSRSALEWGRRNYALNGLAAAREDFIFGDAFDWLARFGRRGQRFDLVIVDPPAFSTTRQARFSVLRDYAELAASAARVVAPGGWLVACANAAELTLPAFHKRLRAGVVGHPARIARATHEPELDFPVARGENPYLKVAFVRFETAA